MNMTTNDIFLLAKKIGVGILAVLIPLAVIAGLLWTIQTFIK